MQRDRLNRIWPQIVADTYLVSRRFPEEISRTIRTHLSIGFVPTLPPLPNITKWTKSVAILSPLCSHRVDILYPRMIYPVFERVRLPVPNPIFCFGVDQEYGFRLLVQHEEKMADSPVWFFFHS